MVKARLGDFKSTQILKHDSSNKLNQDILGLLHRNLNGLEGLFDEFIKYCLSKASQDVRNDASEQHKIDCYPFIIIERLVSNQ